MWFRKQRSNIGRVGLNTINNMNNLEIKQKLSIQELSKVSKRELRFLLELIDVWYPIYKKTDNETKANFISEVFNCQCTKEDLDNLKSFKEITKKRLVTAQNENVRIISRLRWRGRDNLHRNYIHFRT
jgi:hypothetical protein